MILVDSSAWIEFLRATGSPSHLRIRELIATDAPIATTEVVLMELLAGAATPQAAIDIRRLLLRGEWLPIEAPTDWEAAASLHRICRHRGETVRKLTDCLLAAVAIRHDAPVLHRDADFDTLARHTELRLA